MKNEIEFTLSQEISYTRKGEKASSDNLTLKAPSNKVRKEVFKLQQGFLRSFKDIQGMQKDAAEASKDKSKQELKGKDVLNLIGMSSVDLSEYHEIFRRMLCNGICWLDSDTQMTDHIYEMLSTDDTERMLAEYLENFILSSWMKN